MFLFNIFVICNKFLWGVKHDSNLILYQVVSHVSKYHLLNNLSFPHWIQLCQKSCTTFILKHANFIMYYIHIKISLLSIVFQWPVCLVFHQYNPKERKMKHKTEISNVDTQSQTLKWMDIKQTNKRTNKLWIALGNINLSFDYVFPGP